MVTLCSLSSDKHSKSLIVADFMLSLGANIERTIFAADIAAIVVQGFITIVLLVRFFNPMLTLP